MNSINSNLLKISCVVAVAAAFSACTPKLDNDQKKASYAIGQQIGQNMKNQGIDIDSESMGLAIKDVMKGEKAKLTPEEMQQALTKLQEATIKKQNEAAEKNMAEGKKWLEENGKKAGVQTTGTGLQYKIVKEGTGKKPTDKDTVVAHYTGTLTNGQKFDSSRDRNQPAEFPVGGVIPGWTEALKMMPVGSVWELYIPSNLAYGSSPRPGIPANSVLVFEVELVSIKEAAPPEKKTK
ncbi:MAG: FKBP-type peptidyl-prolyl cis-trans isomerase [Pseudobdellovibrionaceae bacterium]